MNQNAETPRARLLLVDDHPILREGLARLINQEKDLEVVGQAEDHAGALAALRESGPDLMIVDLTLASGNGLDLIREVRKHRARLPILVFSMHDDAYHAEQALRVGANGYVTKYEAPETLLKAIRLVLKGELYVHESMVGAILRRAVAKTDPEEEGDGLGLSSREREVFRMLGKGMGTRMIAEQMGVSVRTVDTHRENIKHKLNLKNASELLQLAIQWAPRLS
ncbi:MAG: nreC 2 [Holophagaceae bacterium]|nr:nreC 2 [Holophagaceae bacterium]